MVIALLFAITKSHRVQLAQMRHGVAAAGAG